MSKSMCVPVWPVPGSHAARDKHASRTWRRGCRRTGCLSTPIYGEPASVQSRARRVVAEHRQSADQMVRRGLGCSQQPGGVIQIVLAVRVDLQGVGMASARCGPQPVAYCRALAAIGSTVQHRDLRLGQRIERGGAVGVDPSFTRMQGRPSKRSRRTIGATVAPWLYTGITAQGLCWIAFMRMKNAAGCTGLTGDVEGESEAARAASQRRVNEAGSPGRIRRWNFRFSTAPAQVGFDVLLAHAQCPIELGNAGHYGRDGEVSGEAGQVQGHLERGPPIALGPGVAWLEGGHVFAGACQPLEHGRGNLPARSTEDAAEAAKARHSHGGYATHDMLTQRICDCATATVSCIQTGFGGDDQRRETRRASFLADMRLGDEGMLSQDCFDGRQSDALFLQFDDAVDASQQPQSLRQDCGSIGGLLASVCCPG